MQKQKKQTFIKSVIIALSISAATLSTAVYGAPTDTGLPVSGPCAKKTWAMGNLYMPGDIVSTSPSSDPKKRPSKNYVLGYDGMNANKAPLTEKAIKNASQFSPSTFPAVWKELSPPKTRCAPPTEYVGDIPLIPLVKEYDESGKSSVTSGPGIDPKTAQVDIELFPLLLTEQQFITLFPTRHEIYTYDGLQTAYIAFKQFAAVGDIAMRKRELAAFLANVAHETGGLVYAEQYKDKGPYCKADAKYPCAAGKQYFGRGALHITWNTVYGRMSEQLKVPVLERPEVVSATNTSGSTLVWMTAVWYWMNEKGFGPMTAHQAMLLPPRGFFAGTVAAINGKLECGLNPDQQADRIARYTKISLLMGVPPEPTAITPCVSLQAIADYQNQKEKEAKEEKEKEKK